MRVVEAGRGQRMRVKSSAEVAEGGIQVSVRAKRWMLQDCARSDTAVYFRWLRRERMLSVQTLEVLEKGLGFG